MEYPSKVFIVTVVVEHIIGNLSAQKIVQGAFSLRKHIRIMIMSPSKRFSRG